MKIIRHLTNYNRSFDTQDSGKPLILIPGKFDGIHLGHRFLIKQAQQIKTHSPSSIIAIMTFYPNPDKFFLKSKNHNLINTISRKLSIFRDLGIDIIYNINFNHQFANLSAESFINDLLIKKIQISHFIIGNDFIFGRNREGNINLLKKHESSGNYKVHQYNLQCDANDKKVSSSLIKQHLTQGNIELANKLLTYDYEIHGTVIHGKKLGRTIGFPTANLRANPALITLKSGVYKVSIRINNIAFPAIANFGKRPTINESLSEKLLEVHIYNFEGDIYNQRVSVVFHEMIRDEKKFNNIDELKAQIKLDIKQCQESN